MDSQESVLLKTIRASLAIFPSLQLAIEQGMGGCQAREKEEWMASVIYDFLKDNKYAPEVGDLEDYIEAIMDNEFDTVVDDGSLSVLARNISQLCRLHRDCKHEELSQQLTSLESQKQRMVLPKASESLQTLTTRDTPDQSSMETDEPSNPTDPEGWTVVNNRKRH